MCQIRPQLIGAAPRQHPRLLTGVLSDITILRQVQHWDLPALYSMEGQSLLKQGFERRSGSPGVE